MFDLKQLFVKKKQPAPAAEETGAPMPYEEETGELMITPRDYFRDYLAFVTLVPSGGKAPAKEGFDAYSAMAMERLTQEAEKGVPGALEEMGERLLYGVDCEPDPVRAQGLFLQAAQLGHPEALHMLSEMRRTDQFGCQDMDDCFLWLRRGAERGCCMSMYNLFCAYHNGREHYDGHGFDRDPKKALAWGQMTIAQTEGLMTVIFGSPTTMNFDEYLSRLCTVWNNAVKLTAHQLLDGKDMPADIDGAIALLRDAQQFYETTFESRSFGIESLLAKCEEMKQA